VLGAIAAGGALVILLWLHDTAATLHTLGDYLTGAGRILGLLAGYAVVIQVLLMARLPWLERRIGADRLARWHGIGGRYTVSLIVMHALLITWGYAVTAHSSLPAQAVTLLTGYPDVLMATVAAGLFVGVGITSARAARRRMRYETWYYLHFYTYLAIALAFAHQFAVGAQFMASQPARLLWIVLYGGSACLLGWYRIVVPARRAWTHRLHIHAVHREAPGIVSIVLTGQRLAELDAQPGQFFRWRFLTRDGWWQSHPYSLSAPPHPSYLRITVKALGDHSQSMRFLHPGTAVIAEGPYGAFTADRRARRRVLLLAGGIGITPLRALFETLPARSGELTLLYRVNRIEDVVFRAELEQIARERRARLHYLVGPPGGPMEPLSADRLAELVPALSAHDVFVCGPPPMVTAGIAALRRCGVPTRRIHHESFDF
jgi:predicted ferric reductase